MGMDAGVSYERTDINRTALRAAGVLFFVATATFIAGSGLIESVMDAADVLTNVYENRMQVIVGVLLEYVDAVAVVGIGVLLYPVIKRRSEGVAITYVGTRLIESVLLLVAGVGYLAFVAVSQEAAAAGVQDAAYLQALGASLIAQGDMAFQAAMLMLGLGSLPFCYVLYTTRMVPRFISVAGFVGYVALVVSALLESAGFGADIVMLLYMPGAVFEIVFPLWLIVRGVNAADAVEANTSEGGRMVLSQ